MTKIGETQPEFFSKISRPSSGVEGIEGAADVLVAEPHPVAAPAARQQRVRLDPRETAEGKWTWPVGVQNDHVGWLWIETKPQKNGEVKEKERKRERERERVARLKKNKFVETPKRPALGTIGIPVANATSPGSFRSIRERFLLVENVHLELKFGLHFSTWATKNNLKNPQIHQDSENFKS